jgi:hypothetical protein
MNHYHPRLNIQTKAIMYYDDDGPFYSFQATLGGFELLLNGPGDCFFVSHCTTTNTNHNNPNHNINDDIRYNFKEFANFGSCRVAVFYIPTTFVFCGIHSLRKYDSMFKIILSIPMMGPSV